MAQNFEDHCWKDVVSPETLEVYAHYRRETFIGRRPALLAIDLYNLVFYGGPKPVHEVAREYPSSCGIYAWSAIQPIQELFSACRSRGMPVVYTTTETRTEVKPSSVYATNRQRIEFGRQDFEIKEEFKPEPGDLIIYKERASGFFGTPLIAHLTRLGIDSLIVCGETTSGCVRATTVDGYSYGFHMVVVEEGCFDRHLLSHQINLFDLHHKYADVMHLDEVKARLKETRASVAIA
ncbi:MAG TPA: isochorismatase family protein [Candidatus Acidoferrales bacterium]|nr:isochorismatase family protein [Candidatus Acidoferrales bacterium]